MLGKTVRMKTQYGYWDQGRVVEDLGYGMVRVHWQHNPPGVGVGRVMVTSLVFVFDPTREV